MAIARVCPWLKAIAAIGDGNRVIGNKGRLPWKYPEEARYYRETTKGDCVVMGRRTFEVEGLRDDVQTFVLSTTMKDRDGITVLRSISEITKPPDGKILWVCGGSGVYEQLLPHCSEIYISYIHGKYEGDAIFPEFDHLFHHKETIADNPAWTTKILARNL
jgi:dihydrofolate reductase